jgi:hypothetical protein
MESRRDPTSKKRSSIGFRLKWDDEAEDRKKDKARKAKQT